MNEKYNEKRIRQNINLKNPLHIIAFGFGSGLIQKAPGSFGSLVGVFLAYLLCFVSGWVYIAVTLIGLVVGVWICEKVSDDLNVHDYKGIVWDEIIGILLALWLIPFGYWWIISFILFRILDILKPSIIGVVDRKYNGGLGIMLDDVIAGVICFLIVHCLIKIF